MNRREFLSAAVLLIGVKMPEQQHYWTGSTWLAGDKMQTPAAGRDRLVSAPTSSGWRVDLGDATYPVRYWDGTNTNFTVDSAGNIIGKSLELNQRDDTAALLKLHTTSGSHNAYVVEGLDSAGVRFMTVDETGGLRVNGTFSVGSTIPAFGGSYTSGASLAYGGGLGQLFLGGGFLSGSGSIDLQFRSDSAVLWGHDTNPSKLKAGTGSGYVELYEVTAPGTPASNRLALYAKDSAGVSRLFYKDDAGVEHGPL